MNIIPSRSMAICAQKFSIAPIVARLHQLSNYGTETSPKTKLTYLDVRALGEPIRWIFKMHNVPFEDNRISFADWFTKYKAITAYGKVPVLDINGVEFTQSSAITRLLAKKYNLVPQDDFDQCRCDEVVEALQDIVDATRPLLISTDKDEKKKMRKELQALTDRYMNYIHKILEGNANHLVIGSSDKITWADLVLANYVEFIEFTIDRDLCKKYPLLKEHQQKIMSIPEIAKWIKERPDAP